jgi:uncharacterized protein YydD (DUF2326 family)
LGFFLAIEAVLGFSDWVVEDNCVGSATEEALHDKIVKRQRIDWNIAKLLSQILNSLTEKYGKAFCRSNMET